MSGSGVGRGRGWLNLNKNTLSAVGGNNQPRVLVSSTLNDNMVHELDATNSINLQPYRKLLEIVEQLDPNDDGILLNQKLKVIIQTWTQECKSSADVNDSFKYLYSKCLSDVELSTKVVTMVSSYSFNSTHIHDVKIRNLFITNIQSNFENSKQLQLVNPTALRNSIRMLGEFYHKARLPDGRHIKFLATPIMRCFEILLESSQPADFELFTTQLYLNGGAVRAECPQKLQEILMRVRRMLLNKSNLTDTCRVWLLLALDIVYNRYGLFPNELQKFYQEQLGDKAMANFQGTHSVLSIQTTHSNKSLDSYQSTVSVLQVTPPESTSPASEQNNTHNQFASPPDSLQNLSGSQSYSTQTTSFSSDPGRDWEFKSTGNNREKVGRPILGAGARLNRSNDWDEQNTNDASTGWNSKQKLGGKVWGVGVGKNKGQSGNKNNKGWEHDDRFDNDY